MRTVLAARWYFTYPFSLCCQGSPKREIPIIIFFYTWESEAQRGWGHRAGNGTAQPFSLLSSPLTGRGDLYYRESSRLSTGNSGDKPVSLGQGYVP